MSRFTIELPDDDPRTGALVEALQAFGARLGPAGGRRTLVTGGARSGKSSYAESLLAAAPVVDYVATSERNEDDPEWMARIAAHVARRPAGWHTIETLDVAAVLAADGPPVLVDCLSVWLTRVLDEAGFWTDRETAEPAVRARVGELAAALETSRRTVVLVTNEVGSGIVPAGAGSRGFRDWLGILNATIADRCDRVVLCVAGRALDLPATTTLPCPVSGQERP
ncbi:bifunctional adenosylcobinamide kinase/adenosylcobinamide-phosphate guanylyltransferase [Propionibacterium australiense]|uniref:Adenosylcobinamide kinase n=1 Tax=Propionibacterium australiense TaxID=119981 RepID=A0A383SAE3_9ACTN|nr:bifunctional adenosylcobinamide kinase/adenosylcobinamide-phosphate guanylyltransferase [Propionibacterium australiense]RLP06869.1 bifunctional adenosylcobinamide kinase/adenosylcobinamide-phosphate guanylyltransferase [Propionibacterium australiense]RLP08861.1 bifunctional adenosylcobinamide kinase/adenosylcobinamide-phosphate guanylyltransferase [Propionibacterium australiense]SYZ34329.1 adenosylcobinamide kinase [Propionibacterium australiense]VEH90077.1 Adenosylcobinamide kinase [Propion